MCIPFKIDLDQHMEQTVLTYCLQYIIYCFYTIKQVLDFSLTIHNWQHCDSRQFNDKLF